MVYEQHDHDCGNEGSGSDGSPNGDRCSHQLTDYAHQCAAGLSHRADSAGSRNDEKDGQEQHDQRYPAGFP